MATETIAYNKTDLRNIYKAFKLMDDQATEEARAQSAALAYFASEEIKQAAKGRTKSGKVAQRVADGVSISKSSKIGEFSYGFASSSTMAIRHNLSSSALKATSTAYRFSSFLMALSTVA